MRKNSRIGAAVRRALIGALAAAAMFAGAAPAGAVGLVSGLGGIRDYGEGVLVANDDGSTDLSDSVYLLDFLFRGRSAPPAPFPERGPEPGNGAE